jgi:hypothetical protein
MSTNLESQHNEKSKKESKLKIVNYKLDVKDLNKIILLKRPLGITANISKPSIGWQSFVPWFQNANKN